MSTQNTIPITEYNPNALKEIRDHLEFSNYSNNQVIQKITNVNYVDVVDNLETILNAIESIGYNGNNKDLGICAGLAGIAKQMIPRAEMEFLDSLLIKTDENKEQFIKIETI